LSAGKNAPIRIDIPKGTYGPIFNEQLPGYQHIAGLSRNKAIPDLTTHKAMLNSTISSISMIFNKLIWSDATTNLTYQ
jgi:hypothetical protein